MPKMTMCYRCMCESVVDGRCTLCNAPAVRFIPAENELVLPPGTRLDDGNILVGERLGAGGFGITYVARDEKCGVIALKEFVPRYMISGRRGLDLMVNPDKFDTYKKTMRSFHRESKLLSRLCHPNIVRVLFEMEENNTAYYGMELLKGEDLGKYIRKRGTPLDPRECCELLMPVIDALIYLHQQASLHRDLSPDNIFLRLDPASPFGVSPCLIDFGAASSARQDFTQTVPGVKKNGYSPPEQNWDRGLQGPFTDVYAFAATLYYAFTLKVPLPAGDRLQNGKDVLPPPSSFNPQIPRAVDDLVMHGLVLATRDRIQDMAQLGCLFCAAVGVAAPAQWRMGMSQWGIKSKDVSEQPPQEPPRQPMETVRPPVEPVRPPVEPVRPPVEPVRPPMEPVRPPQEPVRPPQVQQWPPPQQQTVRENQSPKDLLALLLDALILLLLPMVLVAQAMYMDGVLYGFVAGLALMLVVNAVLMCVEPRGTLGQRILGLELQTEGAEPTLHAICFAALRALVPLSLVSALIGMATGSRTILEQMTGTYVTRRGVSMGSTGTQHPYGGAPAYQGGYAPPQRGAIPAEPPVGNRQAQGQRESRSAELICQAGEYKGQTIPLYDSRGLNVGRDRNFATLAFSERNSVISHRHCTLMHQADGWYVEDSSSNGTFLNNDKKRLPVGRRIGPLRDGDRLRFGNEVFVFKSKARR